MSGKKGLTVDQVIAALKETNGNMTLAGKRLKVDRKAIAYYVQTYPTVKQAHDEAAAVVTDVGEGHLVRGVMAGDWDKIKYWLEAKARDRGYGRAAQTNPLDGLTPEQILGMTDDQLDTLIDKFTRASRR